MLNNQFPRRVSFDLSHNVVYVLPTLEECRHAAKQKSREEWQRKTLNEDMISDDIVAEIQEDCYASSRDSEEEDSVIETQPTKSCLKKPPVVVSTEKKKQTKKQQHQKKRKRSKTQDPINMISVH